MRPGALRRASNPLLAGEFEAFCLNGALFGRPFVRAGTPRASPLQGFRGSYFDGHSQRVLLDTT